jgi:hypothetical protein
METNYDSVVNEFTFVTYRTYLSCIPSPVLDSLQCWTGINFWTYRSGPDMGLYENFIPAWLVLGPFKNFHTNLVLAFGCFLKIWYQPGPGIGSSFLKLSYQPGRVFDIINVQCQLRLVYWYNADTIPLHPHTTRWGIWSSVAAKIPLRGKMETLNPKKIEP